MFFVEKLKHGYSTLSRNAHREAFEVGAIIVDHELVLNPLQPLFSMVIKLLAFPFSIRELVRTGEGFGLEVSAVGCEGCVGPVNLIYATPCGPGFCIPYA